MTIDHPGLTVVRGINTRGDLVGRYVDAATGDKVRGYVIWRGFIPSRADRGARKSRLMCSTSSEGAGHETQQS